MDKKLLEILVCPSCKGPLQYQRATDELICRADRLAYPVRDEIPVMLEEEARRISDEEADRLKPVSS
ncbi:MAG TPA: Trm112 family protein [Acidiferrobacteraceae bacterium]|nr:Trm112 family protein [Acidiferrobacteraceae bacterium]